MPNRDFPEYADDDEDILTPDKAKEEQRIAEPPKYAVVFLNDDFTPMDFVVEILMKFFNLDSDSAALIMFDVHKKGKGVAGIYTREIAETKASIVNDYCQSEGHPFRTTIEQA